MNTTHTNSFSFCRLWHYGRAVTLTQKKAVWIKTVCILAMSPFLYLLYYALSSPELLDGGYFLLRARTSIFASVAIVALMSISVGFKRYFTRGFAGESLMLPVSKAEKFVYALVVNCLLVPAGMLALLFLNDALWSIGTEIPSLWGVMTGGHLFESNLGFLLVGSGIIALMSYFFWGSLFFRKQQFLLTALVLFGVWVAVVSISFYIFRYVDSEGYRHVKPQFDLSFEQFAMWVSGFQSLATIGFITWAWQRFRKLQITK